jgi:ATP-dependent 26S proteasome regulatory subunit
MNAVLLKRLFRVIQTGSGPDVASICRRIVEDEKKLGHTRVAEELEKILKDERKALAPHFPSDLSRLPSNRRDLAPLFQEIQPDQLRHEMILPTHVERRFGRIEKEFAARSRLAVHGLKPRRKVLLYGPPGCGKSLGAERLAWNTGLPLLKVRFDTLLSSYFGETLINLRRVFDSAKVTPCALFLDECDTLARSRTERNDIGEVNRITNSLLEMLEDFQGQGLVIAATNLNTALDTALFRRFDEVLKIPLPSIEEITRLLKVTLSAMKTDTMIGWRDIASEMDGMSCSEVVNVAQNAAKHCVLAGNEVIKSEDIRFAMEDAHERHQTSA